MIWNSIGSFGEELLRAIFSAGKSPGRQIMLQGTADDAVLRSGVGDAAIDKVDAAIDADPALMLELIDEIRFRRPLIRRYLEGRAAALKAQGAHVPAGHTATRPHDVVARRDNETRGSDPAVASAGLPLSDAPKDSASRGEEVPATGGEYWRDAQSGIADRSPGPENANPAADGQRPNGDLSSLAVRPQEPDDTNGRLDPDAQATSAVRMPGHAKRGLGAIAAIAPVVARGVLQSIVVDGRRLADLTPREAMSHVARENVAIAKERDALDKRHGRTALIVKICRDLEPDKRIADQIDDGEAQRRAAA